MALTMTTFTTNITAPINNVLMRGLLRNANKVLPYHNGTLPGSLEKSQGSATVKWRRINRLATSTTALGEVSGTLAFGAGRTPATPTITDITVAMAKYGNFILTSEEIDLYNVNSKTMQLMEELGVNAGESLNELMRGIFNGATTGRFGGAVAATTTIATAMAANDIKYSVNLLQRQSALKQFPVGVGTNEYNTSPIRASYFGICHVDVEEDIRDITGFIPVEKYAGYTQTFVGEIGAVNGVRWAATETAPISTSAATTTASGFRGASDIQNDVYSSFVYGKEAVGSVGLGNEHTDNTFMSEDRLPAIQLITHNPGSAGVGDPFNEVGSIAWKAWWAGKILNSNWLVKVETLASDLSS